MKKNAESVFQKHFKTQTSIKNAPSENVKLLPKEQKSRSSGWGQKCILNLFSRALWAPF